VASANLGVRGFLRELLSDDEDESVDGFLAGVRFKAPGLFLPSVNPILIC
jgi:hypothetical protein